MVRSELFFAISVETASRIYRNNNPLILKVLVKFAMLFVGKICNCVVEFLIDKLIILLLDLFLIYI
jgi:hypothetical protein